MASVITKNASTLSEISLGESMKTNKSVSDSYDNLLAEEQTIFDAIPKLLTDFMNSINILTSNNESQQTKKQRTESTPIEKELKTLIDYLKDLNDFIRTYNEIHSIEKPSKQISKINEAIKKG